MKRRRIDPETKMAAVLEGLRGESSIADICRKYQISESLYYRWRDKFLEGGRQAEAKIREGLKNPPPVVETPTDMAFLELVNLRLDYVQVCKCSTYYLEHVYLAKRLVRIWNGINCSDITTRMVQDFLIQRGKDSAFAANKDLRYLRATFNFGIKQGLIKTNPSHGLEFMPVDRKLKYFPPKEDVAKVLLAADPDVQDSLVAMMDTMARVGEINRLTWEDVNFEQKYVVLYNRKKKGGHLTTRKFPVTTRLYQMVLMVLKRHKNLNPGSSGGVTGTGRRAVSWTALSRTARKLCGFSAVRPG